MATQELYYVIKYQQPDLDNSDHFMVMHPPENKIRKFAAMLLGGYDHIKIDLSKDAKFPAFASREEAHAEAKRLGDIASQANPERVDAAAVDPEFPNRTLEIGKTV